MDEEKQEGSLGKTLTIFLAGGLIGAGLALLYAPDSGEKTRQRMKEGANRALQKAKELEEKWLDRIDEIVQDVKSRTAQLIEGGKTLAEDKKRELLAAIEAGKKALEEERKRIEGERKSSQ
jgi:gas vesicle protein